MAVEHICGGDVPNTTAIMFIDVSWCTSAHTCALFSLCHSAPLLRGVWTRDVCEGRFRGMPKTKRDLDGELISSVNPFHWRFLISRSAIPGSPVLYQSQSNRRTLQRVTYHYHRCEHPDQRRRNHINSPPSSQTQNTPELPHRAPNHQR